MTAHGEAPCWPSTFCLGNSCESSALRKQISHILSTFPCCEGSWFDDCRDSSRHRHFIIWTWMSLTTVVAYYKMNTSGLSQLMLFKTKLSLISFPVSKEVLLEVSNIQMGAIKENRPLPSSHPPAPIGYHSLPACCGVPVICVVGTHLFRVCVLKLKVRQLLLLNALSSENIRGF